MTNQPVSYLTSNLIFSKRIGHITIVLLFFFSFFSCKNIVKDESYYQSASQYISAYSGGSIGATEAMRVRLTAPVVGTAEIGTVVEDKYFNIRPKIEGEAIWEDVQTIKFQPTSRFDYYETYTVKVALGKLFAKVPDNVKTFVYECTVRDLGIDVEIVGLSPISLNDATKQQLKGKLFTSDPCANDLVEKSLDAKQIGASLGIEWTHSSDQKLHEFTVSNIERFENSSTVELNWSGKGLGSESRGQRSIDIPALSVFKVLHTEVVQYGDQHIRINFSDPLKSDQNLKGLFQLEGYNGKLRTVIDGNDIRLYPTGNMEGAFALMVNAAIKNRKGKALDRMESFSVNFAPLKPQVRLVGRGNIIPQESNGSVLFPFEAVGLNAIDVEIFKIYNSNILQFLQSNELQNARNLEQVGKIILQKKITLSELNPKASSKGWARYALDIKPLINQDPGAIYQVRLLFRKSYTNTPCNLAEGVAFADSEALSHLGKPDDWGNPTSMMGAYYGIYKFDNRSYYNDGEEEENENIFRWNQRKNPCRREYYYKDNFVKRNVFVSDIGIMAKVGENHSMLLLATGLSKGNPASGVEFDIYNYQLQKILSVTTDNNGTARIDNLPDQPFLVAASNHNQRGYLRLPEGNSLSLSRFEVSGVEAKKGIKGYLYGERGVWRPGDSIYLNFVIEDKQKVLPKEHPVTFELKDARGSLRQKIVTTKSVNGIFPLHCATSADAPTGTWTAKVMVGGSTFSKSLRVETVKPNRLKIKVDFGKDANGIATYSQDNKAKVNVAWLHGATGSNLPVKVDMQVRSIKTTFENFNGFIFDDPARNFNGESALIFDGKTNEAGLAEVPIKINTKGGAPGKLKANFRIRAFEKSGDFSTDNVNLDVSPFDFYTGIYLPEDKWGNKRLDKGKKSDVRFAVVDQTGRPVANREITVGLYRMDWRWWWDSDANSVYGRFNTTNHANALQKTTLRTNAKGEAVWEIQPKDWGRFMVRAIDPIGGHATADFFWTGYPSNMDDDPQMRAAAAMLQFKADKDEYEIGETVTLNVPSSENGRIFVSLENGRGIIDHFWKDAKAGDNAITFQTDEGMASTLYAHVMLLQPHEGRTNDLPIRLYGVVPIKVVNKKSQLQPEIAMPEVIRPGEAFTVSVSEKGGRGCAYTLAIVDEGLLDLTRFKTPNPWSAFNAREGLGVQTWDIYDQVLGAIGGTLERIFGIGGDAFNQKGKAAQVSRFKPVVKHIGPFYLKPGEKVQHSLQLDNYVGSVRAMLVCASPNEKSAYGSTEVTAPVRQPLMVLPTLPRVLGPGETFRLPVNVFAMEDFVKKAAVTVKSSNGLVSVLTGAQNLSFPKIGDDMAFFDIKVGEKTGAAQFTIQANGSGATAKKVIEIEVRNPNPIVSTVLEGVAEASKTWKQNLSALNMTNLENIELEVSAIKPINLSRHLNYLLRYPYGCVEQTTSSAFPQLYVDVIAPLTKKQQAKADKNIIAAIEKLQNFQVVSGGFAYWPGNSEVEDYASSYVGHFLLEAKKKGYQIPQQMLSKWERYQKNQTKAWSPRKENSRDTYYRRDYELAQAYRLYTLSLAGLSDLANMNRLKEVKNLYGTSAHLLAAAYAQSGQTETANKLISQSNHRTFEYSYWGNTYGSRLRDRALELESYVLSGDMKKAQSHMEKIASVLGESRRWYSTQELANCLRAIAKYAEKVSGGSAFEYAYSIDNQRDKIKSKHLVSRVTLDASALNKTLTFENKTQGILYVRLIAQGREKTGMEKEVSKNIDMKVSYVDAKGTPINVAKINQGTDFFAVVSISKKSNSDLRFPFKEMALKQVFPSGWEILSTRLSNVQETDEGPIEYRDIRDDKVYTFFNLPYHYNRTKRQGATYKIQLNAAYPGRYYLPAVDCEAMYDDRIIARTGGQWVEVI